MILAADIGGIKTRLGLFTGPTPVATHMYRTADFERPADLISSFLDS
jgi:glucokinase